MRKRVAAVVGILVCTAWAVSAQERMQTPPEGSKSKAGHAAMPKGSGTPSDAAVIAKAVSAAPPEIGQHATVMGVGPDGQMQQVRAGTNGWMCMLDLFGNPMCLDKEWQAWGEAWMNKKEPPQPQAVGVAYMLKGDNGASNTDPYATKPTSDNQWVVTGPHVMILPTDRRQFDAFPTDPNTGGPWVMWKGTPYAHLMVPVAAMPKTGASAKSAPKASTTR
jgi:hypothetical protein